MAGLLDFNDPQFQRGLMMVAASMPMSEQARAGLLSYVDQQEEAKARREYMQLQMEGQRGQNEANKAKTAAAQAKLDFDNNLFSALMGGGQPQGAGFAPGSVAPDGSRPNAGQGGFIAGLTPDQLAALSMRGHDFTKQYELTRPDMQVANGYAYDKRTIGPGFMPSLQTTADGKSTMTQIGPNGMPIVSAPQGALGTYGAYKGIDANIAAQNDLIQSYNPDTGRMEFGTRAQAVRAANGQPAPMAGGGGNIQSSGYAGGDRSRANAESIAIMKNELMQPGLTAEDKQAIRREISRLEGQTPGAMAAGPSALEQAQQEANKVKLVEQTKADITSGAEKLGRYDSAASAINLIDQALAHPGLKAGTGLSGTVDPRNYIPGTDARNFGVLMDQIQGGAFMQAFQSLKGGGQITEKEGEKAQAAVARMNRSQSTDEFMRSLGEYRDILSTGLERARKSMGGAAPDQASAVTRATPPPRAMKGMVMDGYKFKGGNPADPNNWERQ